MVRLCDAILEAGFIFLIIFTPLAFGSVELWSFSLIEILILFLTLCWLFKIFPGGQISDFRFLLNLFLVLFLLFLLLQLTAHHLPLTTFYFHASKIEFFKILSYFLIFFLIINNVARREQRNRILWSIIGVGFFLALFGIIQKLSGTTKIFWLKELPPRATQFFASYVNRDHFAGYLGMVIPLSLGFFFTIKKEYKILLFFMIALMISAVVFSRSLGGIFTLSAAIIFFFLIILFRRRKKFLLLFPLLLLALLMLFWIGGISSFKDLSAFAKIRKSFSYTARISVYKSTIELMKDYPVFGTGIGTYQYIFPKYKSGDLKLFFSHAHNDYLELLSETGIVGFLLLFLAIIFWLREIFKGFSANRHSFYLVAGGFCALFNIFLFSFFDFNLHIPANALLCTMILGLTTASAREEACGKGLNRLRNVIARNEVTKQSRRKLRLPRSLRLLAMTRTKVFQQPGKLRHNNPRRGGLAHPLSAGLPTRVVIYSLSILVFLFLSWCIIKPVLAQHYFQRFIRHPTSPASPRRSRGRAGICYLTSAIRLDPSNAEYHYTLAKSKIKNQKSKIKILEAIEDFKQAVELNPTNSKYHQSLAWSYGNLARYKFHVSRYTRLAEEYFKKAIECEPNNAYRHRAYAMWCLNQASKNVGAVGSDRLSGDFLSRGIEEYKKAIALEPSLTQEALEQCAKFAPK